MPWAVNPKPETLVGNYLVWGVLALFNREKVAKERLFRLF